jgi:ketosteroid isomerase-like protein
MTDIDELAARIRRLEDREEIKELVARYGFVVDNRDMAGIANCFVDDAWVFSKDGKHNSRGKEDVVNQYHGRFAVLGPTNHFTHNHVIWFDDDNPDLAYGLLNAHGEVFRNGQAMMSALRYDDEYRRDTDGKWRFQGRMMSYIYYLRFEEIGTYFGDPMRVRAYEQPQQADWPDNIETYQRYYEEHPREAPAATG